jgi:F0F1-type ATP synthase delta subunit
MTTEKEVQIWAKALLLIFEVMAEGGKGKKEAVTKLAEILKKKRKGYLLLKIFMKAEKVYLNRHKVKLYLAHNHSPEVIKKIEERFPQIFEDGKNVEIIIDKDLIGGFRVKTANVFIKASVKDYLNELKAEN